MKLGREKGLRVAREGCPLAPLGQDGPPAFKKPSDLEGFFSERLKGLEPSTFCMASRRSSQLSYIRASG